MRWPTMQEHKEAPRVCRKHVRETLADFWAVLKGDFGHFVTQPM